jgi:phosphatidylglycerophosphate synthase
LPTYSLRRQTQAGPVTGLLGQLLLVSALAQGAAGWIVGVACAAIMAAALARGGPLGPASWVTLARATLAVGVATLVADSFAHDTPVALLVALATVALTLDAVDGRVARRTGTESAFGARFDGETDAFLIAALSLFVAQEYGEWVLAIGAARYVFGAGELLVPWMRRPLPPRRWRKVVAATQGIVLTIAAAEVLPHGLSQGLLITALALLMLSMGECVWWLWRRRDQAESGALTVVALALIWIALVSPHQPSEFALGAFVRLPLELLIVVAGAVLLPAAGRRVLAITVGALLSLVVLAKVLDIGFFTAFNRPFRPVDDLSYIGIGIETLRDAIGATRAYLTVALAVIVVLALLVLPVLALLRVTRVAAGRRGWVLRAAAALGVVWLALRVIDTPVASSSAAALAVDEVQAVKAGLEDDELLAREIAHDRFATTPGERLLTALRGKNVLLVFVESYGAVALENPRIGAVLDQDLEARSAFLTSPTFGGLSWLAHSTLQAGVQVDGQRRYDELVQDQRLTLTRAFKRAGWRTVAAVPANRRAWPEGSTFYGYDKIYDRRNFGYRGPGFGLPPMPDQYTLEALRRRELSGRSPLFAEVDLISSHAPWEKVPRLIDWDDVGDGSVFNRVPAQPRAGYFRSIEYSLRAVFSFIQRYGDDKLVVVLLGDHQPATTVTGQGASHDVPISLIARDPRVLDRIAGWGWQDGLRPSAQAPVWPMHAFRDRFLTAFSRP